MKQLTFLLTVLFLLSSCSSDKESNSQASLKLQPSPPPVSQDSSEEEVVTKKEAETKTETSPDVEVTDETVKVEKEPVIEKSVDEPVKPETEVVKSDTTKEEVQTLEAEVEPEDVIRDEVIVEADTPKDVPQEDETVKTEVEVEKVDTTTKTAEVPQTEDEPVEPEVEIQAEEVAEARTAKAEKLYQEGYDLYNGEGGKEKNPEEARKLFEEAASLGHLGATNQLGIMYASGEGGPQDQSQAFYLILMAAHAEYPTAQYNMAIMNYQGIGTGVYPEKALEWALKASEQGHVDATKFAARLYHEGLDVEKNLRQARLLYAKAAFKGDKEAREKLIEVEQEIALESQKTQAQIY